MSSVRPMVHPHAYLTFPRTVLIETFTGVWCIHCPAESQALYQIDHSTSHSVLAISELHDCAGGLPGSPSCYENYAPYDLTSVHRATFYNICGFPDVYFDGLHDACGATNSAPQMKAWYEANIGNASAVPGNVSITQSSVITPNSVSGQNVTDHLNITSGFTGTDNVITYLVEYIGKRNVSNGYGPHDIAYVIRSTLANQPRDLVYGQTTSFTVHGAIASGWNPHNLSVVSFVQDNSTKIIENSNMQTVGTYSTAVSSSAAALDGGNSATITVHVANGTTGAAVFGAHVDLNSTVLGSFNPAAGPTDANGTFTSTFTAPTVSSVQTAIITADVTGASENDGFGVAKIVINPLTHPSTPTGLSVTPGVNQVTLNWTVPSSGGSGVTYTVLGSSAASGPFNPLGTTFDTTWVDSGLTADQTVWFEITANNSAGYSPNSPSILASAVSAQPVNLPSTIGWWINIDSMNFSSDSSGSQVLFLPSGVFDYTFGSASYAVIPAGANSGVVQVEASAQSVQLTFALRPGNLQGTVTPAGASVTVDGTPLPVHDGGFTWASSPGSYYVNASLAGYVSTSKVVTITPGNTTTVALSLQAIATTPGTSSPASGGSWLSGMAAEILVVVIVLAAIAVLGAVWMVGRRRNSPPQ